MNKRTLFDICKSSPRGLFLPWCLTFVKVCLSHGVRNLALSVNPFLLLLWTTKWLASEKPQYMKIVISLLWLTHHNNGPNYSDSGLHLFIDCLPKVLQLVGVLHFVAVRHLFPATGMVVCVYTCVFSKIRLESSQL